jgi:hypothetical protein
LDSEEIYRYFGVDYKIIILYKKNIIEKIPSAYYSPHFSQRNGLRAGEMNRVGGTLSHRPAA